MKNDQKTIQAFYGLFVVFSFFMLGMVIMDWVNELREKLRMDQIVMDMKAMKTRPYQKELGQRVEGEVEDGSDRKDGKCQSFTKLVLSQWREWPDLLFLASLVVVLVLGVPFLPTALKVLTVLLAAREVFQMIVGLRRYIFTFENWVEVTMVVLVLIILFASNEEYYELKKQLAGISLFLSWTELITLVAKHPDLTRYNIYVTMFHNVLKTFAFFLFWYVFYIIAFGLGFYIMLHKVSD